MPVRCRIQCAHHNEGLTNHNGKHDGGHVTPTERSAVQSAGAACKFSASRTYELRPAFALRHLPDKLVAQGAVKSWHIAFDDL